MPRASSAPRRRRTSPPGWASAMAWPRWAGIWPRWAGSRCWRCSLCAATHRANGRRTGFRGSVAAVRTLIRAATPGRGRRSRRMPRRLVAAIHDPRRDGGNRLSATPQAGPRVKTWTLLGITIAVAVGSVLPLQALINARLGALTHGALYASFVSFLVGTCLPGSVLGAPRPARPLAATVLVPRLGAGALFCLIVLGQVLGAMALDHFGVLGAQRPVDMARVAGALLVVVGAALVVRPWQA